MNKAVVIAAAIGGALVLGSLCFPSAVPILCAWCSTPPAAVTKTVPTDGHAPLTSTAAGPTYGSLSACAPATDHPPTTTQMASAPTADAEDHRSPSQELLARQERSNETFRRAQESFRAYDAQQAANPKLKTGSTHTGGMGMPLVCEPNQHGIAIIHEPVPFGFIFDPKEYPNRRIELRNVQGVPLVVTVHGEDEVFVNGQPATTGVAYPIDGSLEITSPGQVRIHVAPGSAAKDSLDGRG